MPEPSRIHRSTTRAFAIAMLLIGVALIVRTVAVGGGPAATGVILGLLFIVAGAGRLYLQLRRQ